MLENKLYPVYLYYKYRLYMSLYDVNTKQFVFAYHKECVSQYYIHLYLYMFFFF